MRPPRHTLACLAVLALAIPGPSQASSASDEASGTGSRAGLSPGSAWDSGPGRHRAQRVESDPRRNAARALDLRRLREDESRDLRASHDTRQAALRGGAPRHRDPGPRAALERERRLDDEIERADRHLELDAAGLRGLPGPGPSPAEAVRARMRRELDRTQQRVERNTLGAHGRQAWRGSGSRR